MSYLRIAIQTNKIKESKINKSFTEFYNLREEHDFLALTHRDQILMDFLAQFARILIDRNLEIILMNLTFRGLRQKMMHLHCAKQEIPPLI